MKTTVADMQTVTDEVKQWKQRGIGALAIVGFGASALTWIVTYYFDALSRFVSKS